MGRFYVLNRKMLLCLFAAMAFAFVADAQGSAEDWEALMKRVEALRKDSAELARYKSLEKNAVGVDRYVKSLEARCDSLQKELDGLSAYAEAYAKEFVKKNRDYLSLPFAELDMEKVRDIIAQASKFKDDAEMRAIARLGGETEEQLAEYTRLHARLEHFYQKDSVDEAIRACKVLATECDNAERGEELKALAETLGKYAGAQKAFVELFQLLADEREPYIANKEDIASSLRDLIKDTWVGMLKERETRLVVIPYLASVYADLERALLEDPLRDISALEKRLTSDGAAERSGEGASKVGTAPSRDGNEPVKEDPDKDRNSMRVKK